MKTSIAMIAGSLFLLGAGLAAAQTANAPASAPNAALAQSGSSTSMGGHMGQMDEHMKRMQALHDKFMSAATPEERQKVMDEQRKEMEAGMGTMNHMQGGAMMGGMAGPKGKAVDAGAQMQMMQKRVDMMHMMMQTMMDQQGMMGSRKGG